MKPCVRGENSDERFVHAFLVRAALTEHPSLDKTTLAHFLGEASPRTPLVVASLLPSGRVFRRTMTAFERVTDALRNLQRHGRVMLVRGADSFEYEALA